MTGTTRDGAPPPPATEQITLRQLISDRPFALYLVGQTTSGAGGALSSVALVFAVLSISRSAAAVGLVLLAARLPGIALALGGGVIADRWSRRWVALGADVVRTVMALATGALLVSGHASVVEIAALQCVSGGASAVFNPAANALLGSVAPRGQIRRASSLLQITTATAQTGGLALSGVLVALAGPGISLLIDGATFGVSAATLALLPVSAPGRAAPATRVLVDLRDGWRVVRQRSWLIVYAAQETIVNVLVLSPFFVLGPVLAKQRLGGAPAWSAIVLGYVIGNLAAAHITYRWAPRRPILAVIAITPGLVPMLALIGWAAPLWLIVPGALLAGAETTITNTLLGAALLANLPERTLGRATALTSIGSTMLVPVGMGLAGVVAGTIGSGAVLLGAAAIVIVTTVVCVALPATRTRLALDRPR